MIEFINCIQCKRLFQSSSNGQICPACLKREESLYQEVKSYVYDHKGISIYELESAFEGRINSAQIKEWIKDDRLSYTEETVSNLKCENCGKTIFSGRLCQDCKLKSAKQLQNSFLEGKRTADVNTSESSGKKNEKMRFLRR